MLSSLDVEVLSAVPAVPLALAPVLPVLCPAFALWLLPFPAAAEFCVVLLFSLFCVLPVVSCCSFDCCSFDELCDVLPSVTVESDSCPELPLSAIWQAVQVSVVFLSLLYGQAAVFHIPHCSPSLPGPEAHHLH